MIVGGGAAIRLENASAEHIARRPGKKLERRIGVGRANDGVEADRAALEQVFAGALGHIPFDVEQQCLEWVDPPGGRYSYFRCKHYAHLGDAACKSKQKVHERFCIDEKERTEPGSDIPRNHMSWTTSKKLCEADGARLCLTREWVFACEGEEMRPYPYGWDRDSSICNADIDHGLGHIGGLVDHRAPASAHPQCKSAFGLYDMAGNVDEWTTIEGLPRGSREVMHGSWWMPGRNVCRAYQAGHGAFYEGTESGSRCCADPLQ